MTTQAPRSLATRLTCPGDLLDAVNGWNERHPDQPFTVEHHVLER